MYSCDYVCTNVIDIGHVFVCDVVLEDKNKNPIVLRLMPVNAFEVGKIYTLQVKLKN